MIHSVDIFRDDRGIVVLQSLKVSHLSNFPNSFYESPNLKTWICKLCMFSQIQSHNYINFNINPFNCSYVCLEYA